ncbi:hypothetical protein ATANTOWER_032048 [Ataeniobius toweri]|uniref:Uncharacterized protein n=1 Tax=Ataeniobius toweri TaxID=208326 RepID=A0ABU7AJV3_9TELE|nr:hypothetical protein [Ataeniobius toweri]
MGLVIRGNTSLNNLVGIGSNIQVEGLDEANISDNSGSSTGSKQSKHKSGSAVISNVVSLAEDEVIIFGSMSKIFFLIESILFKKNPIKSWLLRAKGMDGSTEL